MWIKKWMVGPVFAPEGEPAAGGVPQDTGGYPVNTVPDAPRGPDETADFVVEAFSNMERDYDDEDDSPAVEPTAPPAVSDPAAANAAPGAVGSQPAAEQKPPANPAAATGQATPPVGAEGQPQVASPGAPAQPPSEAGSPDQIWSKLTGMIEQNRQAFTEQLAQKSYQLSPTELEEFQVDPARVIANIAARVQVQTTESLMKVMHQQLPIYMNGLMQVQAKSSEAENRFWAANPGLNKEQHVEVVKSIGSWYRSQNPNGDESDFIKTVGNMAMARLGLVHNAIQQAAATQQATQPHPGYALGTPGRVVRQVMPPPPVPGMHGAPPSSQPQQQLNEWDRLSRMMETYDD